MLTIIVLLHSHPLPQPAPSCLSRSLQLPPPDFPDIPDLCRIVNKSNKKGPPQGRKTYLPTNVTVFLFLPHLG